MAKNNAKIKVRKKKQKVEWWLYIPIILAFGYVPLIVHSYLFERQILNEQTWYPAGESVDFFMAYKSFAIIVCGVAAAIFFFASLYQYPFKRQKIYIPAAVYAVFVLLSGIISPYRELAFQGSVEMFESVPVVLSYLALMIAAAHFISYDGARGIRIIVAAALPGLFFMMIVGVCQFFGADLFRTDFAQAVIVGENIKDRIDGLQIIFDAGTIYGTLYNPNYLGTFFGLLTPMFFGLAIYVKNRIERIVLIVALVLSAFNLYGSRSLAGLLTLIITAMFGFIVYCYRRKRRAGHVALISIVAFILAGLGVGFNVEPLRSMVREELFLDREDPVYNEIRTGQDGIDIFYDGGMVRFTYSFDENGELVANAEDESISKLELVPSKRYSDYYTVHAEGLRDDGLSIYKIEYDDVDVVGITSDGDDEFRFYLNPDDNTYYYVNALDELQQFVTPDYAAVFPTWFMSGRGSIWNYTFPTLPSHMLIGSGSGTYIMVYPQDDYITSGGRYSLDVKPHSVYLQQWSDSGFIAMVAFIVLFMWFIAGAFLGFVKKKENAWLLFTFMLMAVAYLAVGLANDSIVCTGPMVWSALGMGLGLFLKEKTEDEN